MQASFELTAEENYPCQTGYDLIEIIGSLSDSTQEQFADEVPYMTVIELFSCEDLYDADVEQIELIFSENFYYFEVLLENTFFIHFNMFSCIPLRFYTNNHISYQFSMVMEYFLMFSSIDTQKTKSLFTDLQ